MYQLVNDVPDRLDAQELAELSALADGTLPASRREAVEARVAASPELQELVARQRRALAATATLEADRESPQLRAVVESLVGAVGSRRRRARRLAPRFVLAFGAAAAAAVVAAVLLSGGPGAPTVADAAQLASQSPTAPAPRTAGGVGTRLAAAVDGLAFPDLARFDRWRAVGARRDHVDGRDATVVFYRKGARRLAYVIVAGAGLQRPSGGESTLRRGVEYQTLRLNGRLAVTWRRRGHTCVLLGQATRADLIKVASWPLTPPR